MRPSRNELLVQASARRHAIENLLVQFSVLSFVIMVILGVVLTVILTTRLNEEIELLNAAATVPGGAGTDPSDLNFLRWTIYVAVGGGFVILYGGLLTIVWRGWRTIENQQTDLLATNDDLMRAYKELQEAQEKVVRSERLAAIGELSAGVAHDLRNPLGAIKNAAYYTKRKLENSDLLKQDPRIAEFLEVMDEEIESSNQIVTDLMDFAKVNPPNQSPTSLETVVDSAIARTPLKGNVRIEKQFDPSLPLVPADSEQLRRAFGNLLKNAGDAMPSGGVLTIAGRARDGQVELEFTDKGTGIPGPNLPRILDPLYTTKAKGIGLGLAIVSMIVDRHEGTISVDSTVGEGTTFRITLPIAGSSKDANGAVDGE